jgi:ADP-heptose:LPS heptosyltransferase
LCARPEWRVLFPGLAWVESEAPWGRHARAQKYVLREYFGPALRGFLRTLRATARGAVGIDTRGDIRSVLLLHLAGCRRVITISSYAGSNLRMLAGAAERVEFSPDLRRWEMNLRCAAPLGLNVSSVAPPSFAHLHNPATPSLRVGLVPIAPWEGKWWQREKWSQLSAQLKARHVEAVGLCGPGQGELARRELGGETVVIECGSVEEWARRLQEFAAVVTLDSGPMHLADALGVPVMALFGQGSLPLWAPSGPASAVITHQSDPHFRLAMPTEENTESGREFMRRISVEEVLAALEQSARRPASS